MHNLRTEYSLYCPTLKGMQYNRFIIRLKLGGHSLGKGRGKGKRKGKEKRKEKVRTVVTGEARTRALSLVKTAL